MSERLAERARIVLLAADGQTTMQIAHALHTRPARVSKWRTRFASGRLAALAADTGGASRGREERESGILKLVQEPPPEGRQSWTGDLVAKTLGNVSADQVWRILRKQGIRLARRRGQYIQAVSAFRFKLVDVVGLYLHSHSAACVISTAVCEGSETSGFIRIPDSRLSATFTTMANGRESGLTLVDALDCAAGLAAAGRFVGPGRRTVSQFVREIAAISGTGQLYVIFVTEENVREDLRGTPHDRMGGYAEWFECVRNWLSILGNAQRDQGSSRELIHAMRRFVNACREKHALAFEWRRCPANRTMSSPDLSTPAVASQVR
jgi:transposase